MVQEQDKEGTRSEDSRNELTPPEPAAGPATPEPAATPEPESPVGEPEPSGPETDAAAPAPEPEPPPPPPEEPELVRIVLHDIVRHIGIRARIEVERQPDDSYYANIKARHSNGLLIGHRGSTLRAIQYLVRLIVKQTYPDVPMVMVDVSGYRVRRENFLRKKATAVARIVMETGREMALDLLTEKEMETVQDELGSMPEVRVYALGTGTRRNVIIAPAG
ncbi:KH domain-containing protein [candidate division WOR-3 bacterium]|nr:KH domain-containing protein [candidate division WOR-3 bacterium]